MGFQRHIEVYLLLERSRQYKESGNMNLVSATQGPPTRRPAKTVLVKVKVLVPDEAFDPAKIPAIVAEVPLELLHPAQDEIVADVLDATP